MILKTMFFNHSKKTLQAKLVSLIIAGFVAFNCMFAFNKSALNIEASFSVQKDIFSAVFFVSDTIGKISSAVSDSFKLRSEAVPVSQKQNEQEEKTTANTGSAILPEQVHSKSVFKTVYGVKPLYAVNENFKVKNKASPVDKPDKIIVFYFLIMLLFFIAAKKSYDGSLFPANHRTFI